MVIRLIVRELMKCMGRDESIPSKLPSWFGTKVGNVMYITVRRHASPRGEMIMWRRRGSGRELLEAGWKEGGEGRVR